MSFGLKNIGATYQQAISAIFYNKMYTIMNAYVDVLLIKSKMKEDYIDILAQVFY